MFSINVDWENYYSKGWENIGRNLIEQNCTHHREDKETNNIQYEGYCEECGHSEDSCQPMMNYAYPLETTPDDKKIIEVCEKTNCTVMYNENDDSRLRWWLGYRNLISSNLAIKESLV